MSVQGFESVRQVKAVLESTRFKTALKTELERVNSLLQTLEQSLGDSRFTHGTEEDKRVKWELSRRAMLRKWRPFLDELAVRHVLDVLPRPAVVSKEDIIDAIMEEIPFPLMPGAVDVHHPAFVMAVLDRLDAVGFTEDDGGRHTLPERIDVGFAGGFEAEYTIAKLPSGLKVVLQEILFNGGGFDSTLLVTVEGVCSLRALDRAARQCFEIMRAVIPPFIQQQRPLSIGRGVNPDERPTGEVIMPMVTRCLMAYFAPESKKPTLEGRRIRNAIGLMVESDRQDHDAVGLALSFAAIEALVCRKTEGIVDELSRNVATLLVPNADDRRSAINGVKDLYDRRSKALHGERLTVDSVERKNARELAAAVLRGVLDWQEWTVRAGEKGAAEAEFFAQMQNASDTGRRFVGPPERLWNTSWGRSNG